MPKENTHAYFAQRVLSKLEKEHHQIANKIKSQKNFYILGGYSPDVFFYSKKPEYKKISDYIHGHGGEKTNMIPRELAEKTKVSRKTESEAFLYGFLTHLAMDIVFHPVIFYLTGNPYSKNKEQNPINFHRHRQLETALDKNLHRGFGLLDPRDINIQELLFIRLIEDKFNADKEELLQTYRKHFSNNLLFRRKYLYYLILFLNKINILKISDLLGLFYQNAKRLTFQNKSAIKTCLPAKRKKQNWKIF